MAAAAHEEAGCCELVGGCFLSQVSTASPPSAAPHSNLMLPFVCACWTRLCPCSNRHQRRSIAWLTRGPAVQKSDKCLPTSNGAEEDEDAAARTTDPWRLGLVLPDDGAAAPEGDEGASVAILFDSGVYQSGFSSAVVWEALLVSQELFPSLTFVPDLEGTQGNQSRCLAILPSPRPAFLRLPLLTSSPESPLSKAISTTRHLTTVAPSN